jgi:hypothetical protein
MATLDIIQGSRAKVFRVVVAQLRADPVLNNIIRTWLVWDGDDNCRQAVMSSQLPALRLTPTLGPGSWYSPDSQVGMLTIKIELAVPGIDADDPLNLWDSIEAALYPTGDRPMQLIYQQALRDRGAEIGQMLFAAPAFDPGPPDQQEAVWACEGSMSINIIRTFNP